MNDETRNKLTSNVLDMVQSFQEAVHNAGGMITIKHLRSMTIDQMFSILAPNRVHFFHNKTVKGELQPINLQKCEEGHD